MVTESTTPESSSSPSQSPIKTVVVLVQENRSFDHMLGWLKTINPEINGVTGSESNPISTSDSNSNLVYFKDQAAYVDPDPGHSIQAIYEQVFGVTWSAESAASNPTPKMNGFAQNAERTQKGMAETVMNGFKPDAVPVYKELAENFAVCDQWFASVPASTQPNRLYVHSATSHGATSNDTKQLAEGFPQKTIFESMEESGFSFGIYYQYPPATLFYRNLRKLKYVDNFHQFDLSFKKHCEEGKLPNYVVVEQRYFDVLSIPGNDDHPSHDISQGQKFVKQVYESLRSSPQWNEILFVIIYDEHGGFYDHVPTPTGVPSPDDFVGPAPYNFKFDRLGVRIPAFLISPWIQPGTVVHEPSGPYPNSEFEHSSIPATVKKIFNLNDFLTKRDAWAGTFDSILTLTTPRTDCPLKLGEPVKLRDGEAKGEAKLNEFQEVMVQMTAALLGEHKKKNSNYPDKLVQGMTVADALKFSDDGYKKFIDECGKARANGADDNDIIVCFAEEAAANSKSAFHKFFSCLVCNHS
ncbi:Non-specific phospholipase C4 [Linum perenne]